MEDHQELTRSLAGTEFNPFPGELAVAVRRIGDVPARAVLAEELETAHRWSSQRRLEFLTGRACARGVLSAFGLAEHAVLREPSGAPGWPQGISGSIAHTKRFAIAVGTDQAAGTVGVDVEETGSLEAALYPMICTPRELHRLDQLGPRQAGEEAETIFTLKEAFYKAQFARTAEWLNFHDVETDCFGGSRFVRSVKRSSAIFDRKTISICRTVIWCGARWSLVILR